MGEGEEDKEDDAGHQSQRQRSDDQPSHDVSKDGVTAHVVLSLGMVTEL
jgi:hypothetical protein